jgi:hypothetical protein
LVISGAHAPAPVAATTVQRPEGVAAISRQGHPPILDPERRRHVEQRPEGRPILVTNPADDEEFGAHAARLLEDGAGHWQALQACLRQRYPRALVRPRDLAGEHAQVWYVYRDGHWVRPRAAASDAEARPRRAGVTEP